MNDESRLESLAGAILAGEPVDWDAEESRAPESDRAAVRELRLLARIAALGGTVGPDSPAPPHQAQAGGGVPAESWGVLKLMERVGSGAFGEVFRAWDTRLEREVALKLFPPGLSGDHPSARLREARSLARVRHTNVVTVHGADEIDGRVGLWTEFVSGRTLEEMLKQDGASSPAHAARIGIDVCRALGAVHAAGLLHGDIKAQNVMCEDGGRVVLMDFGMARAEGAAGDGADDAGGTPLYMAPELLDRRPRTVATDIYAVGVLLHRMASGSYPLAASTVAELRAAHASGTPLPLREARPGAPEAFANVVDRALARDPSARFESAETMERALAQALAVIDSPAPAAAPMRLPRWAILAVTVALVTALAFVASRKPWRVDPISLTDNPSVSGSRPAPPVLTTTRVPDTEDSVDAVISPDGQRVAHVDSRAGRDSLWITTIATGTSVQIVPPNGARFGNLAFSTDGREVFYVQTGRALYHVPVSGGTPTRLMGPVDSPVSFSPDGKRVAFVRKLNDRGTALIVGHLDGSAERTVATRTAPEFLSDAGPAWSSDGRLVVCGFGVVAGQRQMGVLGIEPASGREQWVAAGRWQVVGRLAWLPDSSGLLAPLVESGTGPSQIWLIPHPVGEARRLTGDLSNYSGLSLAADARSLVAIQYEYQSNLWVVPAADAGGARPLANKKHESYRALSWTPSGAVVYVTSASGNRDIWVMNGDGTEARQLTRNSGANLLPDASPDGRYILFSSNRAKRGAFNIWRIDIDGAHPVQLTHGSGEVQATGSPDGRWVVYSVGGPETGPDKKTVWKMSIDGLGAVPLTTTPASGPDVSPDGTLVATWYKRNVTAPWQIAFIPLAGGPPVRLIDAERTSILGLRWAPDGRAVVYVDTRSGISNIWSQPIAGGPPKKLTQFTSQVIEGFDVRRDGMLLCSRGQTASDVVLIKNFR
jgi:eukaryotic-like serine/threonine-protein kinase